MKRALGLAMVLVLVCAGFVAADAFPVSTARSLPAGQGWRVIYADRGANARLAHSVDVATDRDSYHALWGEVAGLADFAPYVNFERNIVALFAQGTGPCTDDVFFSGVIFERGAVYAQIDTVSMCAGIQLLSLTGSAVFLVTLDRTRLPPGAFPVRLCRDCSDGVIVDL